MESSDPTQCDEANQLSQKNENSAYKEILNTMMQLDVQRKAQYESLMMAMKVQHDELLKSVTCLSDQVGNVGTYTTTPTANALPKSVSFTTSSGENSNSVARISDKPDSMRTTSKRRTSKVIREERMKKRMEGDELANNFRSRSLVDSDFDQVITRPSWREHKIAFMRFLAKKFVHGKIVIYGREFVPFDYIFGVVIFVNAVFIGIESNESLQNLNKDEDVYDMSIFSTLECVFLGIYYTELFSRVAADGWRSLTANVVPFDVLLVFLGSVSVIYSSQGNGAEFKAILVLRLLRLLRLLRSLRMIKYFKTLWKLIYGLATSFGAIASTVALIVLSLYIAACAAVELIATDPLLRSDSETREILDYYFASLGDVMTLFIQFVTLDSVASVYIPLIKRRRYLLPFFVALIMIVSVALMNLVTAVLIESAIENTKADKEVEKSELRRLRPKIHSAFKQIDANGDGILTRQELYKCFQALPGQVLEMVPQADLADVFDLLDSDDSQGISEAEFVEGVLQLVLSDYSFMALQELRLLKQIKRAQEDTCTEIECLQATIKGTPSLEVASCQVCV